ncbi:acyl carrier protein-like [Sycon ciliatum]|uniref:acyl carrier protein-like n=1 Tax=Sycon ciliatum TaxID=27933 RepID=UPI0031F69D60
MACSSVFRLLSCRSMAQIATVRPTAAGMSVFSAARSSQFSASRCLVTSAVRCSMEKLSEKDQQEVRARALNVVKNFQRVDPEKVTEEAKFIDDLGLDSLDAVEIVMALEDEFEIEISDEEAEQIASLRAALDTIALRLAAK